MPKLRSAGSICSAGQHFVQPKCSPFKFAFEIKTNQSQAGRFPPYSRKYGRNAIALATCSSLLNKRDYMVASMSGHYLPNIAVSGQ